MTDELGRESLAHYKQELFTLFHKGLSLQNISMIQNDLNVQVVILTAAKFDMRKETILLLELDFLALSNSNVHSLCLPVFMNMKKYNAAKGQK